MDIYDPPLGGLVDVKVHGYDAEKDSYLVRIESEGAPTLVPAKDVHVEAPDDFDGDFDFYTEYDHEESLGGLSD